MDFNSRSAAATSASSRSLRCSWGSTTPPRLLGVSTGAQSPIELLGVAGFTYLAAFSLAQLFAAVGLWIRASWGAVLLVGATVLELGMYLFGNRDIQMSALGFAIRLVLLVSIAIVFLLSIACSSGPTTRVDIPR